ncbi:MAG: phosphotransferase, partial [Candidatus Nanohaloarchaea archaeon]
MSGLKNWIRRAAARELGERPEEVKKIGDGLVHETFRLRFERQNYILQYAEEKEKRDSISLCLELYRLLANSGIPVPETVTGEVQGLEGRQYIIVEESPGNIIEDELTPTRVMESGRYLAKIHSYRNFDQA